MSLKQIKFYIFYGIIFCLLLDLVLYCHSILVQDATRTFASLPPILFLFMASVLLGLYMRLFSLRKLLKVEGKWRYDWIRLILTNLPIILLLPLYFCAPFGGIFQTIFWPIFRNYNYFLIFSGMFSGYTLLACLNKE